MWCILAWLTGCMKSITFSLFIFFFSWRAHSFHLIQIRHFLLIKTNSVNIWFYQFMTDVTKFISGCMASLSAMVQLELPHVNILSKMDLVAKKRNIEEWALLPFTTFDNLYATFISFNDLICFVFLWCQFFESRASIFVVRVE